MIWVCVCLAMGLFILVMLLIGVSGKRDELDRESESHKLLRLFLGFWLIKIFNDNKLLIEKWFDFVFSYLPLFVIMEHISYDICKKLCCLNYNIIYKKALSV